MMVEGNFPCNSSFITRQRLIFTKEAGGFMKWVIVRRVNEKNPEKEMERGTW